MDVCDSHKLEQKQTSSFCTTTSRASHHVFPVAPLMVTCFLSVRRSPGRRAAAAAARLAPPAAGGRSARTNTRTSSRGAAPTSDTTREQTYFRFHQLPVLTTWSSSKQRDWAHMFGTWLANKSQHVSPRAEVLVTLVTSPLQR